MEITNEKLLTRAELCEALREHGYPIALASLAKYCLPSVNSGPPAETVWGRRPLYRLTKALEWARNRSTKPAEQEAA